MYKVLYVDDEPDLLSLGKVFLEMSGFITVETALSAQDGIQALEKTPFDCIISDFQMPEMDGIAFLKYLRTENNRIPFILFTGRGREEVVIDAVNNGVDFYLQKGGDARSQFVELEHKIRLAVERRHTEDELKESRQRMTEIIDHLPDATFAIDLDGKVIAWNRAMEEMTGVLKENILGTGDHSYALPFYGTRRPILLDLVLRDDKEIREKYPRITRKDNKLISEIFIPILYGGRGAYLWFIASPLYDTHGSIIGAIESIRDITDRKKTEDELRAAYEQIAASEEELRDQFDELKKSGDALRESEENYRTLFDEAADIIVIVDAHGTFLNLNRRFVEESGYGRDEMAGKNVLTSGIVTAPSAAKIAFHLGQIFIGRRAPLFEIEGVIKNGTIVPYEIRATPVIKNNKITAVQATLRNLSERKQAEKEIGNRKKILEEIVSGSPIPQFVIDKDHRVISWNRALEESSGVKAADVLGTTSAWKAFYDTERPVMADLLVDDDPANIPVWYAGKFGRSKYVAGAFEATDFFPGMGGRGIWLYFTAAVIRDSDGRIVGAVETLEDITERKSAEEELLASYEQIAASEEELRHQYDELKKGGDALRESEEKYRNILENIQDVYYRSDREGNLILASPSAASLLGYDSVSDLIGKNIAQDLYYDPEERSKLLAEISGRGSVTDYEVMLKKRDGTPVPVSTNSHKYFDSAGSYLGVEGTFRDISGRKLAEEALRESERRFRAIFDQTYQFMGLMTPDGTLVEANQTALAFSGIKESDIMGKPFWETPWWTHSEELQKKLQRAIQDAAFGEFVRFEATHPGADGNLHYIDFSIKPVKDETGQVVLLIPEGRDITERKNMEIALRANEEKYRSLVDNLNVGVYRNTPEFPGRWLSANPALVRIFGYDSLDELLECPVTDIYANSKDRENFIQVLKREGFVRDHELRLKKKDGTPIWVSINAMAKKDPDGTVAWIDGICDDITALKDAEERAARYQLEMSRAIDYLPDATFIIDRKGMVIAWNRAIEEMTGVQAKDIIGRGEYEYAIPFYGERRPILIDLIFAPEDELKKADYIEIKRAGEILSVETQNPILKGKPSVVRAIAAPIYNEYGNVAGAIETITDITELKRAQEDLKESENRYRTIFENTGTATVLLDENTIITIANAEFERLSGYSRDELEGKRSWTEFVVKEDLERMLAQHRMRRERHETALRHYEFRFVTKTLKIRNIFLTVDVIPGTKESVASLLDITEREQAKQQAIGSSRFLETLMDTLPVPVFYKNVSGEFLGCNREFEELIRIPKKDLIGKTAYDISKKELADQYTATDRRVLDSKVPQRNETQVVFADGSPHDVIFYKAPLLNPDGSVAGLIGMFLDITERKRVEERLSEMNSAFLAFSPDPIGNINILTGLAGKMLRGTCALYNRLERGMLCSLGMWNTPPGFISCDKPDGHICNDIILNGSSSPTIITDLQKSAYADTDPNVRRYQLRTYVGIPVKFGKRYFGSLCVVYQNTYSPSSQELDILSFLAKAVAIEDERRSAGLALQESEERYSAMVNHAPEPVLTLKKEMVLFINDTGVRVSGYSREEIIGKSIFGFLTEDSQKTVLEAMRTRTGKDNVSNYEVEFIRKDGRVIRLIVSAINISDQGEMITLALLVDITERNRAEEALKLASRKLSLLSGITRHDIKNQLQALTGYLEMSGKSLEDPARISGFIDKEIHVANTIARLIDFTRDYEYMGVKAPSWRNVQTTVSNVIPLLPMRDIHVDFGDPALEVFADPLLERVFYNLIDNALRYGGNRMTTIRISSHPAAGTGLVIVFEDDGTGIALEDKNRLFERGFGKNTGLGLFLSREILGITGITIAENSEPGRGARFEITVPKGAYRFSGTS
ncbi:MAG: PAS domain S-box protein [Methanoregula sp.]